MRLNIYVLATDDNDGTQAVVFATEGTCDDALLAWVDSDRAEWAESAHANDLHEFVLSKIDHLDTFSTDTQKVEIDPAQLMTVNEAWKVCKDNPGSFGNLYDPDEVMTILDGWADEGDKGETSYWFDPDSTGDRKAILAWCEQEGPDFEDQISELVCSNLPSRGDAFAALKKKLERGQQGAAP